MFEYIRFIRKKAEILERKSYYLSALVVGACVGLVIGTICAIIAYVSNSDVEAFPYILGGILVFMGWNIYMNVPLRASHFISIWIKIFRPLLGMLIMILMMFVGIIVISILLWAVAIILAFGLLLFLLQGMAAGGGSSSNSDSSTPPPSPDDFYGDGKREVVLDDNTTLTEQYKGSGVFDGPCNSTWHENIDGTFTKDT